MGINTCFHYDIEIDYRIAVINFDLELSNFHYFVMNHNSQNTLFSIKITTRGY